MLKRLNRAASPWNWIGAAFAAPRPAGVQLWSPSISRSSPFWTIIASEKDYRPGRDLLEREFRRERRSRKNIGGAVDLLKTHPRVRLDTDE
jgi:hypothetical protein